MGFNKFVINIIIRTILIALTALIMMLFISKTEWLFTFIFTGLAFVFQVFLLIKYIGKVNHGIANFLIHLREQNTSLNIPERFLDPVFGSLSKEMFLINEEFKKIENEKIQTQNFLDIMLNRVGTGILVINSENQVKLHNKAFLKLLGVIDHSNDAINQKINEISGNFTTLNSGEQNIVNLHLNNITRRILIALTEIKENNELLKIYTFHDIDREMTDYELQSWNGLIKVLSHEILNTLTPMSTSVETIKDCLIREGHTKQLEQINQKDIDDSIKGIQLLENRVHNLQDFIIRFRQVLDIPTPELKPIYINELISNVTEPYRMKTKFNFDSEKQTVVLADNSLIELVLINIIKNSIEANATEVSFIEKIENKQVILNIVDNGNGFTQSSIKKAFLPFYSTKESGSGIGLSLARQIMFAHGGNIEIEAFNKGTIVKLTFKTTKYE